MALRKGRFSLSDTVRHSGTLFPDPKPVNGGIESLSYIKLWKAIEIIFGDERENEWYQTTWGCFRILDPVGLWNGALFSPDCTRLCQTAFLYNRRHKIVAGSLQVPVSTCASAACPVTNLILNPTVTNLVIVPPHASLCPGQYVSLLSVRKTLRSGHKYCFTNRLGAALVGLVVAAT